MLRIQQFQRTCRWKLVHKKKVDQDKKQTNKNRRDVAQATNDTTNDRNETHKTYNTTKDEGSDNNNLCISLDVADDMGWHKWSNGHPYDSKSGHTFLIGMRARKIIGLVVE